MKKKRPKLKLVHQINSYFCGPAVIQMILRAYGIRKTQRVIAKLAGTTEEVGTSTKGLVSALKHYGAEVFAGEGKTLADVQKALANNQTVIVCYTEPRSNEGHYSVVAGFKAGKILLFSPDERGNNTAIMTAKEFEKRWHDPLFTRSERWAAFVRFR